MAVINSKEGASRPLLYFLELGLNDIKYNAYAIFIVVSDHALMCICSIGHYDAVLFRGELCWVVLLFELLNLFPL